MADRELNFNVTANARGVAGGMINVRREIRETQRLLDRSRTSAEKYSDAMDDIARKRDLGLLDEGQAGRLQRQLRERRFQESGFGQLAGQIPGIGRFLPRAGGPIAMLTAAITGLTAVMRGLSQIHKDQLDIGQRAAALGMPDQVRVMSRLENNMRDEAQMSAGAISQTLQGAGRLAQERFGGDLGQAVRFLDRTVGRARGVRQLQMAQEFGVSPEAFNLPEGMSLTDFLTRVTPGETRPSDVEAARWRGTIWGRVRGGLRGIGTGILRNDPWRIGQELWNMGGDVGGPHDLINRRIDLFINTAEEHHGPIFTGMGAT